MNKLFNCKNVRWNGVEYEELPEEDFDAVFEDEELDDDEEDFDENVNEEHDD